LHTFGARLLRIKAKPPAPDPRLYYASIGTSDKRTRSVCRWRDSGMVKRWMASALLATEKNFRRIMGYRDLWTLDAILNGSKSVTRREVAW
jgi:hypothetical protein